MVDRIAPFQGKTDWLMESRHETTPTLEREGLSPELKPCPFCSERAQTTYIRDGRVVVCLACGSRGPPQFHGRADQPSAEDRAIAAWNRRSEALSDRDDAKTSGSNPLPGKGATVGVGAIAQPLSAPGGGEAVAWRVKDLADGWILCESEEEARTYEAGAGHLVEPLYAVPPTQTPPEGWVLVPREPTAEMLDAADDLFGAPVRIDATPAYRAMLSAVPPPPSKQPGLTREEVAAIVEGAVANSIGGDWEDAVKEATDAILRLATGSEGKGE